MIGVGLVLAAASPAAGQAGSRAATPLGPKLGWQAREFQDGVNGADNAVDIAYWIDNTNPQEPVEYVYITGYHTTANGATVFATFKYRAVYTGPGENQAVAQAFFPSPPSTATGTNKAVAMSIDDVTGDVYVTGESTDPEGVNGQDYVTIRYDKDLDPFAAWTPPPAYNGPANGDDVPVDIMFVPGSGDPGYVVVTGRSAGGVTGDDIATVLYDAVTGVPSGPLWPDLGDGPGVRRYSGDGPGGDEPVGVFAVVLAEEIPIDLWVFVAGTKSTLAQGKDIVTLAYANDLDTGDRGSLVAVRVFNGVDSGDDVATAMVSRTDGVGVTYNAPGSFVAVCGYTPHDELVGPPHPNDTDYVVLNYQHFSNQVFLIPAWTGVQPARFFNGPALPEFSDDRPLAIDAGGVEFGTPLPDYVWITGRVREADGTDYDVATVVYNLDDVNAPAAPLHQWIWGVLAGTNEWGTAVDSHDDIAYVGGRMSLAFNTYATFRFNVNFPLSPEWTALRVAFDASDTIEAIVGLDNTVRDPVFVTGGSSLSATGKDQFTLCYDQP